MAQAHLRRVGPSIIHKSKLLPKVIRTRSIFRELAESKEEPLARRARRRERVRPVAVGSQPCVPFGHGQPEAARLLGLVEISSKLAPQLVFRLRNGHDERGRVA